MKLTRVDCIYVCTGGPWLTRISGLWKTRVKRNSRKLRNIYVQYMVGIRGIQESQYIDSSSLGLVVQAQCLYKGNSKYISIWILDTVERVLRAITLPESLLTAFTTKRLKRFLRIIFAFLGLRVLTRSRSTVSNIQILTYYYLCINTRPPVLMVKSFYLYTGTPIYLPYTIYIYIPQLTRISLNASFPQSRNAR